MLMLCLSCTENGSRIYLLEGGDKDVDVLEFVDDSTLRWMAPGSQQMVSNYKESEDGLIVVYVAPFSLGTLHRVDAKTIQGDVPFFEGTWKVK